MIRLALQDGYLPSFAAAVSADKKGRWRERTWDKKTSSGGAAVW